jgi:glycyl-tRNA synthetase beta chain
MTNPSLLVELFTEELPPRALKKLGEAFASGIAQGLVSRKLVATDATVSSFTTPRRLAVLIESVCALGPEQAKREKVLPVSVALDATGKAQAPLLKKLTAMGLDESVVAKLERAMDGKAEALFHHSIVPGKSLALALQEALDDTLKALPIPKVMFYERDDGTAVNFVRPVHRLIALHGADVVSIKALGLKSGRVTQGHRFHSSGDVMIASATSYVETLKQHHVIASYTERRAEIAQQLKALARGDDVIAPDALLDEVNSLVEWPRVYECHFEKQFLEVPQECLILTMQTNQKYFATQCDGKLTNRFLIVSNIQTNDASQIIGGNERVVRPRLADAKFFFDQDRKQTLVSRLPKLDSVVYHNKLGSQGERNKRVTAIAGELAKQLSADVAKAERAARLSKADLVTDMVSEFPELQGVMGEYYALHDGEDAEVAQAIREHYMPRFAGDALPATMTGIIVALADKLETLAGMFGMGAVPTGDKDPFALRRHALGVIRLLREKSLQIRLDSCLNTGLAQFHHLDVQQTKDAKDALNVFIFDRLSGQLKDDGYKIQEVDAVLSKNPQFMSDIAGILSAVRVFSELPEAQSLAAANKRITNILKKAEGNVPETIDANLLIEDAEKHLFAALKNVEKKVKVPFENKQYTTTLQELAVLRAPVDAFFDTVMVNADDAALRNNRLALLKQLHMAMNRVADLSKLAS